MIYLYLLIKGQKKFLLILNSPIILTATITAKFKMGVYANAIVLK